MSTLSPAMGATCGRREREAGAGNGRSNPFHVPTLAAVEGILVHATSSTFAGRRSNVSLGRSDTCVLGLVPMQAVAPMTTGALWEKEEGNVVSMREAHALDTRDRGLISIDTLSRTRPSLGPETRARQSALHSRWATTPRCAAGDRSRYRGRENLRKQEEPAPGP
jgi:hypothetical protein